MKTRKNTIILITVICISMLFPAPPAEALGNAVQPTIGQITLFAFDDKVPQNYLPCDGRGVSKTVYQSLYVLLGNTFGGDANTFNLPDLSKASPLPHTRYYMAVNTGTMSVFMEDMAIGEVCLLPDAVAGYWNTLAGGNNSEGDLWLKCDGSSYNTADYSGLNNLIGSAFGENLPDLTEAVPQTGLGYYIATAGVNLKAANHSEDGYVSGIDLYAFSDFTSTKYISCDGGLLPISGNTALFSLLGPYFGGDGQTNFALPDLGGAAPLPGMGYFMWKTGIFPTS